MEVASKVRGACAFSRDGRSPPRRNLLHCNANHHLFIQVCLSSAGAKFDLFAADAIHTVQMSRFVRASKYRQEHLRIHPQAGH